jgi:hypothetical protein
LPITLAIPKKNKPGANLEIPGLFPKVFRAVARALLLPIFVMGASAAVHEQPEDSTVEW